MPLSIDACVAQHLGDRREQQDRVGLFRHPRQKGVLAAVVADGMGGHSGGALAAEQVVHTAGTTLERFSPKEETAEAMLAASFAEAHMLIRTCRLLNEQDPHSTGVMLVLQPVADRLLATWAHCGDSRLYRFRGSKTLLHTRDHSRVEDLLARGEITPAQAATHPQRNVLSTSLGGSEVPRIDYAHSDDLVAGDGFLLCSDGLWGYCRDAELAGVVAAFSAREAAEVLIQRARQRAHGQGDNCSLAILKLIEVPAGGAGR